MRHSSDTRVIFKLYSYTEMKMNIKNDDHINTMQPWHFESAMKDMGASRNALGLALDTL
jgi:hypothetical protein